jgi:hypothetical protein
MDMATDPEKGGTSASLKHSEGAFRPTYEQHVNHYLRKFAKHQECNDLSVSPCRVLPGCNKRRRAIRLVLCVSLALTALIVMLAVIGAAGNFQGKTSAEVSIILYGKTPCSTI